MKALAFLFAVFSVPALAQDIQIVSPWSRATPGGAKVGVGFMEIRNRGAQTDRIVGATTPVAGKVEMHVTAMDGGVARMREVPSFDIPAGGAVELKPGGGHLMLMDLARPLKVGERVPLTLRFERAGERTVEMEVYEFGARSPRK